MTGRASRHAWKTASPSPLRSPQPVAHPPAHAARTPRQGTCMPYLWNTLLYPTSPSCVTDDFTVRPPPPAAPHARAATGGHQERRPPTSACSNQASSRTGCHTLQTTSCRTSNPQPAQAFTACCALRQSLCSHPARQHPHPRRRWSAAHLSRTLFHNASTNKNYTVRPPRACCAPRQTCSRLLPAAPPASACSSCASELVSGCAVRPPNTPWPAARLGLQLTISHPAAARPGNGVSRKHVEDSYRSWKHSGQFAKTGLRVGRGRSQQSHAQKATAGVHQVRNSIRDRTSARLRVQGEHARACSFASMRAPASLALATTDAGMPARRATWQP